MAGVVQWGRAWDLVIGLAGAGVRTGALRISFHVEKTAVGKPNDATIKIYNLAPSTESRISDEFTDVVLNAGYKTGIGLIFKGNITLVSREKTGPDTITEIACGDGDEDYRNAFLNETVAAGTDDNHVITRAAGSFTAGTVQGPSQIPSTARARGRVLTGPTRDVLESIARANGCNWSIQDGRLVVLPADQMLPGSAILISPSTGMVGAPTVTDKGFKVKTLLNWQYKIGGAVKIDSAYAQMKAKKLLNSKTSAQRARLPPNGICKVVKITHTGDTRGNDWYSELETVAI
jgi:hypothetical protein